MQLRDDWISSEFSKQVSMQLRDDWYHYLFVSTALMRTQLRSRHLNGAGMGFIVNTAKKVGNAEIWSNDPTSSKMYADHESYLKSSCDSIGADLTVIRAGTLKGGGCGEKGENPEHMTPYFYSLTKRDIVTWQLLFDCRSLGVKITEGDVCKGPGAKAILTAQSDGVCEGDSGRGGVAGAIVQCLKFDNMNGKSFGVETREGRFAPNDHEWERLFKES